MRKLLRKQTTRKVILVNFFTRRITGPSIIGKACIALIKLYKLTLSPFIGWSCRFHPTCSTYALEAFQSYGVFYAFYLTAKRLLKCQPFHPGGFDPLHPQDNPTKEDLKL